MWLYLAALMGIYVLHRWYRQRQTVDTLTEKHIFITGCDSGFGNLLARQLDAKGMRVLAACFTEKGAEQLQKATSERLRTTILDITSTESVAAATEWVKGCVGNKGLWGLVNNAGILDLLAPTEWLTKDDFAKVINVNLLGTIDVMLHMMALVRRARGRIVNISSMAGRVSIYAGGYCPSKYGIESFSDSLRREIHPFGVKVSIVEPGTFFTPIFDDAIEDLRDVWSRLPSEIKESYGEQYFKSYCNLLQFAIEIGNKNLCLVTDCIEHALTSSRPCIRYIAGWDAKFLYIPLSYLPASVADFILEFILPKPAQTVSIVMQKQN
ncbi:17-beta-hydroxysteroid dehydrogenase type 6-like [Hemicordylus capensis]|uniref:17-beta-hydroxysteroid dehydrogenase type 6-like n=1 Tax=Hemicordylus capensis TaxID=884348 RepID=UPI0023034AC2|nr:17-beta-hydroxysteroid dehydrogenase type 6-like [Hemicordylus capensis]XP_053149449.1 17-beta-hydroxysteroid dehydrogenase type 6-like [Hemicordylus capensis]